jgi:short-subunit dehydrogenase
MLSRMSRPVALVTGPTAGIGLEFARQLAQRGYDLVLVARDRTRLDDLAATLQADHGTSCEVIVADLSQREQMPLVERRLADSNRPVELLVNNAGFGLRRKFLDNPVDDEVAMLDVLVTAVLRLSHAALTGMVDRGHGGIINVSSVAGHLPRGTYSAAKAYVTRFSEWADLAYRKQGVRTMVLLPGFTKTEFHERMDVSRDSAPAWMWLEPDRLVRDALDDFDKGRMVSVPSKRFKVLSTLAKYTPISVQARFEDLGRGR